MRPAPLVSQELLDYLDSRFPDKCPDVSTSMDEVRALAGAQRVIRHLRQVHNDQTKVALTGGRSTVTLNSARKE